MGELFQLFLVAMPAVFFVVDPIGVVPIFLSMTHRDPKDKAAAMARRACIAGGALLGVFALFGGLIFKMMGVSLSAFRVAGGILLLITALDMLRAKTSATRTSVEESREAEQKDDISIVPLAIPLLAGPGSIATVMVLMSKGKTMVSAIPVLLSIAITFVASYYLLRGAFYVQKVLGTSGVAILQRVMGLILAAIAVQFMAEGGRDLLLH